MDEKKISEIEEYMRSMDLPFSYPLIEALIREDLSGVQEGSDAITQRIYGLAGSIPPGKEAPLLFEQIVFDLYKEQKKNFQKDDEEIVAPLRERLMLLFDRWTQLNDFLNEEEQENLKGKDRVLKELNALLNFAQGLLNRVNHPEKEKAESFAELGLLSDESEAALIRIMESIDALLHPELTVVEESDSHILTLKIQLDAMPVPVWRRIKVSSRVSLSQFHSILQKAMGWWELYPHNFEQAGKIWTAEEEENTLLSSLLEEEDDLLHYYYDQPRGWHHKILVESAERPVDENAPLVLECLAGECACPPEDSGGPEGFRSLLASLAEDASAELKEDYAWASDYNPEDFSLSEINKALRELL